MRVHAEREPCRPRSHQPIAVAVTTGHLRSGRRRPIFSRRLRRTSHGLPVKLRMTSRSTRDAIAQHGNGERMLAGLLDHAEWIVFALIFANQAGIPVFAAPALLAVGALAWTGDMNVAIAIAGATAASLCADLGWYTVGSWRGHWALAALGRLSRGTRAFVDDAQRLFLAHDRAFQFGARFLPELNPVAAAFAGVARAGLRRFVLGAAMSAAIWAGTWIGVGYLVASTTRSGAGSGIPVFWVIVAASVLASLTVVIQPVARGIRSLVRSLRAKASARPCEASRPADDPIASRRSVC